MFTLPDKTVVLNLPEQVELNKTDISDLKTNEANNATEIATNATNVSELQTRTATLESRTNSVNGSILTGKLQAEKDSEFGSNLVIDGGLTLNSPSDLHFKTGDTDYSDFNEFRINFYSNIYRNRFSGHKIYLSDYTNNVNLADAEDGFLKYATDFTGAYSGATFYNIYTNAEKTGVLTIGDLPNGKIDSMFSETDFEEAILGNYTPDSTETAHTTFAQCRNLKVVSVEEGKTFVPSRCFAMFYGDTRLEEIGLIDFSNNLELGSIFTQCSSLKNIHCTHFRVSFDISASTQFEQSDLVEIIGNLDSATTPQTLTMGATNLAKLTQDQILVATGKGWTLA